MNSPGSVEAGFGRLVLGEAGDLTVTLGLELDGRDAAAVAVQAAVVEPVDALQRRELDVIETSLAREAG